MASVSPSPRWPVVLWGLQLPAAAVLAAFGYWRLTAGAGSPAASVLAVAGGGIWVAITLLVMVRPKPRRWLVAHRREWCLTAVTLLVCTALFDAVLTITGLVPTIAAQRAYSIVYSFNRASGFRLVPQDVLVDGGAPIHINRRGFRGPEIDPVKKPGRTRVVFLGGSQVFDFQGGGWPAMVGEELGRRGHDVEVINAGVPGTTTADSLSALATDLWMLKPDIIFLCQAWNDIKYFGRLGPAEPYRGLPPLVPAGFTIDWRTYPSGIDAALTASALYRRVRRSVIDLLFTEEAAGAARFGEAVAADRSESFGPWGPAQYRLNLDLVVELAGRIGARVVLCKQAHLVEGAGVSGMSNDEYVRQNIGLPYAELLRAYAACDREIDDIARAHALEVVDMHAALSKRAEYFLDTIHFSPAGSRVAARLVAAALRDRLVE